MEDWKVVFLGSIFILVIFFGIAMFINQKGKSKGKLLVLIYTLMVIWLSRFFVSFFSEKNELSLVEKGLDSFVHAMLTFSMDEDYTGFTVEGKEILSKYGFSKAAEVYGIVISVLNVSAPILGGAILLEILTNLFPNLVLWFHPRKRKFVFSELNEESIILAEDLLKKENYGKIISFEKIEREEKPPNFKNKIFLRLYKNFQKPIIIFSMNNKPGEMENKSNLVDRSKAIRAISIDTDLSLLNLSRSKVVYYFLVSNEEEKNSHVLSEMIDRNKDGGRVFPRGRTEEDVRTKIFVFCKSESGINIVNLISSKLDVDENCIIRSIPDYRNAAVNLLYEVPLFISLLHHKSDKITKNSIDRHKVIEIGDFLATEDKEGRLGGIIPTRELHVAIVGKGLLLEELLKAIYWCGQIAGVQLYISVICPDGKKLKNKINSDCPELLESCLEESEMLKCYRDNVSTLYNSPYAVIDGLEIDIDLENFEDYKSAIDKSDYVIVSTEEDSENITITSRLKQELSRRCLSQNEKRNPVIALAILEEGLAKSVEVLHPNKFEPYIIPFALRKDRYSCKSVFMSDITVEAWKSNSLYSLKTHKKRMKDEYSYWANINRAIHAPYKLFSFSMIENVNLALDIKERYQGVKREIEQEDVIFSWLEHRRWNAYMRSQGFTKPSEEEYERYYSTTGQHKDLLRKYHNCLVESTIRGKEMPKNDDFDKCNYDALDLVSIKAYHLESKDNIHQRTVEELQKKEYKQWDDLANDIAAQTLMKGLNERFFE